MTVRMEARTGDGAGMDEVVYRNRVPGGLLGDTEESLWYLRAPSPQRYERILPLPAIHLVVNLGEPYTVVRRGEHADGRTVEGPFVVGVQATSVVNLNPAELHHAGAQIRPERFGALSGVHVGQEIESAEALIPGIDALAQTLAQAHAGGEVNPDAALDAVEAALTGLLRPEYRPDPLVDRAVAMMHERPDTPVNAMAAALGVSHKTLIAHVSRECGLTPKRLADVIRMHRFVTTIPQEPPLPTWSQLAAQAGYFDQPHFIRSFARMVGSTPREYLERQRRAEHWAPSFVPLEAAPEG